MDVLVTTLLHRLLCSLELLGRASSFLKNKLLDLLLVLFDLRHALLDALHVVFHIFSLHELTADNRNLFLELEHNYLR